MPQKFLDSRSSSAFQMGGDASATPSSVEAPMLEGSPKHNYLLDFSTTSTLSSVNQIKNAHLPYRPLAESTTLGPFLEAVMHSDSGKHSIASLLPSLSTQIYCSPCYCTSIPNNSSGGACPAADFKPETTPTTDPDVAQLGDKQEEVERFVVPAQCAVNESQKLTSSGHTTPQDVFSSAVSTPSNPSCVRYHSMPSQTTVGPSSGKGIASLPVSLSAGTVMPTYKVVDSMQRSIGQSSSASCSLHRLSATLPTPPQRRTTSVKLLFAIDTPPKPDIPNPPRRVTFNQVDDVVEIPCRLDKEELTAQLEEAMAEALQEAATAEEEESNAALEVFKTRYQFAGEIMSLTSFGFGFGEPSQEARSPQEPSPSLVPQHHSNNSELRVDTPSLEDLSV
eukprot:GILI01006588.1.p1 GENE.GILI01006588.1~~GILI01006588.1.p1  ORF type:complete len:393 (+),score=59.05 GILI01006588.1:171-1349(+)